MSNTFRHHPDGIIYINDKSWSLEDFQTLEPDYSLPSGMKRREYVQGVRHSLYTEDDGQTGGEFPWTFGDEMISRRL